MAFSDFDLLLGQNLDRRVRFEGSGSAETSGSHFPERHAHRPMPETPEKRRGLTIENVLRPLTGASHVCDPWVLNQTRPNQKKGSVLPLQPSYLRYLMSSRNVVSGLPR